MDAEQITRIERKGMGAGVTYVELWSGGGSHAGVMWFEPDAELEEHTHRRHSHHVWVVAGEVEALGRRLGPGSYAFVPPRQRHGSVAGPEGAQLFYLFLDTGDDADR